MTNIFNTVFKASKNASVTFLDDWDDLNNDLPQGAVVEKVEVTFNYDFDTLAFVLAALDNGHAPSSAYEMLVDYNYSNGQNLSDQTKGFLKKIPEYADKSAEIKRHFKNNIFMRRLTNKHISKYMIKLEELLDKDCRTLTADKMAILVKLPAFYQENLNTVAVLNNHVSVPNNEVGYDEVDDVFSLVGTVNRQAKNEVKTRYYLANSKKHLLLIEPDTFTQEETLLKFILNKFKSIGIKGTFRIAHQPGHDEMLMYKNGRYEFYEPNS